MTQPHDALRDGLTTLKDGVSSSHPVESIQLSQGPEGERSRAQMLHNVYGSALPARQTIEKQILSRCGGAGVPLREELHVAPVQLGNRTYSGLASKHPKREIAACCVMSPRLVLRSRVERLPGLPSSRLGLESMTGELDDFGFESYLGLPSESEVGAAAATAAGTRTALAGIHTR